MARYRCEWTNLVCVSFTGKGEPARVPVQTEWNRVFDVSVSDTEAFFYRRPCRACGAIGGMKTLLWEARDSLLADFSQAFAAGLSRGQVDTYFLR